MIGLPRGHQRQARHLRQARRVSDAAVRHHLPEPVLAIVDQARPGLEYRPAIGARVHGSGMQLIQVREQHLESMGVYAPQIGRDQRVSHE